MPSSDPTTPTSGRRPTGRPRTHRAVAALAVAALAVGGVAAGSTAAGAADPTPEPTEPTASTNQAPVAVDDTTTVRGNQARFVDVLANDSDPDGDDLRLCRVDTGRAPISAQIVTGDGAHFFAVAGREVRARPQGRGSDDDRQRLFVYPQRNRAGTYTIRYGVCDRDEVRFATVRVRVVRVPELRARTVPGRPGVVQFTNPTDKLYVVQYTAGDDVVDEGTKLRVHAHDRVRLRTSARRLTYLAYQPRGASFVFGEVRGIQHPKARPTHLRDEARR